MQNSLVSIARSRRMWIYCSGVITGIFIVTLINLLSLHSKSLNEVKISRSYQSDMQIKYSNNPIIENSTNITRIKLLCIISTYPANWRTKVNNIVQTWSKRCDNVVFITPHSDNTEDDHFWDNIVADPKYKVIEVKGTSSRNDLWIRLKDGLIKTWEVHQDFDFVMKCDDDTYVVVDNLKHRLHSMDPSEKSLLGHVLYSQKTIFISGGSGMVISRAGLEAIVETGLLSEEKPCNLAVQNYKQINEQPDDDLQIGGCAKLLNFTMYSSEDNGRITFFPFKLESHLTPEITVSWWEKNRQECVDMPAQKCPGDYPVAFHYVTPEQMYILEYFLYTAKVHKVQSEVQEDFVS